MKYSQKEKIFSKKIARPSIITGIYILTYTVLLLFKHVSLGLSLREFNPLYPGNLFISVTFIVLVVLQIWFMKKKKGADSGALLKITIFSLLSLLFLVLAGSIKLSGLKTPDIYLLRQPLERVMTGGLLLGFLLTHYYLISYLWFRITGTGTFVILRALLNSVFILFALFLFTFFYSQTGTTNEFRGKGTGESRVAVVLGAAVWSGNQPSDVLTRRLEKALQLYNEGLIGKIQLMGGSAPGELSEAEVAYNYLREKNMPLGDLLIEKSTSSTTEQIKYISHRLNNQGEFKEIIIISDRFHLVRINEIAKFYKLHVSVINSDMQLSKTSLFYHRVREGIALLIFWLFGL